MTAAPMDEPPPQLAQPFVIERIGAGLSLKWAVYCRIGDGRGAKTFGTFDSFTAATRWAAELTREYRAAKLQELADITQANGMGCKL